jgi:hypothetical protein
MDTLSLETNAVALESVMDGMLPMVDSISTSK